MLGMYEEMNQRLNVELFQPQEYTVWDRVEAVSNIFKGFKIKVRETGKVYTDVLDLPLWLVDQEADHVQIIGGSLI